MPEIYTRILQDKLGNYILPVTHERNVRDSEGVTLDVKLAALQAKTALVAWDGTSEPVVANIPAGVTVTYDGTDYTGTLAASSATDGFTYLVSTGNDEYDRYVSSVDTNNQHVWIPLGSTAITLRVIDDLVTGGSEDALSAQQGVVLKGLVDGLADRVVYLTESAFEALTTLDPTKIYCTYEDEEEQS